MVRRLSGVQFEVADLPGTYLALTRFERDQSGTIVSSRVTIDHDAAGYGWFVDPTPFANEEFAPREAYLVKREASDTNDEIRATSDAPWQFIATPDGPAAGTIDLLTTIYHELGHVMGLDHVSSDIRAYDVMNPILQVGVRSLPTSFDLSLFSDDVTYWDGLHVGSGFSGGSSASGGGSGSSGGAAIIPPQFHANNLPPATHTDILNGTFANENLSDPQFAWDLRGDVSVEHGAAVLREDGTLNSRLSQAFFLPAGATHLQFTILNVALSTQHSALASAPPDAFEVALLDSVTLTPLTGVVDGLTLTDALLNIQAGGTTYTHAGVTLTPIGTSGTSYLVDVDLTGVTVGAGARLYFDLLGFGDRTSTVVLDNVLLTNGQPTAAPVAVNDSYTIAEGATLDVSAFGLLTNDSDPDSPTFSLTTFSLTAPLHGTLTLNADGSFTYVHNGSETVTDSFTYQISDGINFSNLATVSLTITPTNDAPVIAPIAAQSVEQGRTLTVNVFATDPDDSNISPESSALTFSLQPNTLSGVTLDPATGLLSWAVPRTQTVGLYTIAVTVTDAGTPALSATRSFTVDVLELTNTAPTLDPIGAKTVNEDTELRFTISATDLDIPAQLLTFSASGLPTGATFDVTTHEFNWTPAEARAAPATR
jgi:VCBS repeat-containing protein